MNILLKMTIRVLGVRMRWYDCMHPGYMNYIKGYFVTFSLLLVAHVCFGYTTGTNVAVGMVFNILDDGYGWVHIGHASGA